MTAIEMRLLLSIVICKAKHMSGASLRLLSIADLHDCTAFDVTATAIVTRNYVITYDNQLVPLDSGCELMLAHDVSQDSFTLNYDPSSHNVTLMLAPERHVSPCRIVALLNNVCCSNSSSC